MSGVILIIQPTAAGWQVTVCEAGVVLAEQVGYLTWNAAQAAGQVWVALHRSGVSVLTEIRSVPDGAADGVEV